MIIVEIKVKDTNSPNNNGVESYFEIDLPLSDVMKELVVEHGTTILEQNLNEFIQSTADLI